MLFFSARMPCHCLGDGMITQDDSTTDMNMTIANFDPTTSLLFT